MVADFTELHDEIHKSLDTIVVVESRSARHEIGDGDVLAQCTVHDLLPRRQVTVDVDFDLGKCKSVKSFKLMSKVNSLCPRARSEHSS